MQPGSFTAAPSVGVSGMVDSGPSLLWMLVELSFSAFLCAGWLRAVAWARRQDRAVKDASELDELERIWADS